MELDDIEPAAADVVRAQARRVFIGDATALKSFGAAATSPNAFERFRRMATALADDCLLQRAVRCEEIDVLERRSAGL